MVLGEFLVGWNLVAHTCPTMFLIYSSAFIPSPQPATQEQDFKGTFQLSRRENNTTQAGFAHLAAMNQLLAFWNRHLLSACFGGLPLPDTTAESSKLSCTGLA